MPVSFPQRVFVTGIGTDVGKTVVSAILCKALNAAYFKPIQAGGLEFTDTDFVSQFGITVFPEAYRLKTPASPHYAAEVDNVTIDLEQINIPQTNQKLVIEGAGGVMVPLNNMEVMLDIMVQFETPVIVVSRNYLGSINHTLLTCEMLNAAGIDITGIIFNGDENPATERFILEYTGLNKLGHIPNTLEITTTFIENSAVELRKTISDFYSF